MVRTHKTYRVESTVTIPSDNPLEVNSRSVCIFDPEKNIYLCTSLGPTDNLLIALAVMVNYKRYLPEKLEEVDEKIMGLEERIKELEEKLLSPVSEYDKEILVEKTEALIKEYYEAIRDLERLRVERMKVIGMINETNRIIGKIGGLIASEGLTVKQMKLFD